MNELKLTTFDEMVTKNNKFMRFAIEITKIQ